ncbi:MAG: response regulator [Symbiobacterium sp.]|uniref:two-component system response regulator n=1 Tax=Symbiobacterium sp. TaxID=1971213 RepID=UPI0034648C04
MDGTTATILVVEDDKNSAMLIMDLLTAHGYRAVSVESGKAAAAMLAQRRFDLVILDLRLPEQTGFVVAEAIRRNPATAHVPIVVASAYTDRQNRLRAYRSGINVVLSKPIDTTELVLVVKNLLAISRAPATDDPDLEP